MFTRAQRQKMFPWYYQLSHTARQRLTGVFMISLALHLVFVVSMGSVVIFRYFKRPPAQFTAPPPPRDRIEPRKLEYQVKVAEQQKKSGRPTSTPRLTASSLGAISLPAVKTEIKPVQTKAVSSLASFGGSGFGTGLGGGSGSGGLGLGVSQVNFFGITDRGERIAFLVDCSLSMLEDPKGGIPGYNAVKAELAKYVNRLAEGTFFNIILFATDVDIFKSKMVLASPSVKEEVETWLKPYNSWSSSKGGTKLGNLYNNWRRFADHPGDYYAGGKLGAGGSSRMDLALACAFEQGADTIFVLSDGLPVVGKVLEGKEKEKYDKMIEEWHKSHKKMLENWKPPSEKEQEAIRQRQAAWQAQIDAEDAARAKKGLPPKVFEGGRGGPGGWGPPSPPGPGTWTADEILGHLKELCKDFYDDKKKKPPRVHCVSYMADPGAEEFLRDLASKNHGRFRKIKPLVKPIVFDAAKEAAKERSKK